MKKNVESSLEDTVEDLDISNIYESDLQDDYHVVTPPMHDPSRLTSTQGSAASLVATMLGGGVLSLPYALSRAGLVLGMIYMVIAAILNVLSLEVLFACSRRTGCISYEEIAEYILGKHAKNVCRLLVFLLTYSATIGYCILIRDLSIPLFESYILGPEMFIQNPNLNNYVGICLVALVSPLCFFTSLKSLNFASKFCMGSIVALICALILKIIDKYSMEAIPPTKNVSKIITLAFKDTVSLQLWSLDIHDTLYSFPFMQVAFLCHFNALPVYTGLKLPTRKRIRIVIWTTVGYACLVYAIIGIVGYLYAYNHFCDSLSVSTCVDGVPDDIFNAFNLNDVVLDFGRLGLLITVVMSLPLLVLPSRHILISFCKKQEEMEDSDSDLDDLEEPLLANEHTINIFTQSPEYQHSVLGRIENRRNSLLFTFFDADKNDSVSIRRLVLHILSTVVLLVSSLFFMIKLPGIGFVWSITGSSLGFLMAYTLPCFFYTKLHNQDLDFKYIFAKLMLPASIIMIVGCTYESIRSLSIS